jgi:6-phosphogluconate dehydrogenase
MKNEAKGTNVIGATSLENMVSLLKKPRRVMLLVKAGSAVDVFIDKLVSMSVPSIFPFVFSVIRLIGP